MTSLVVVESSTKAQTLGALLGPGFIVLSTDGPLRTWPKTRLGVSSDWAPEYVPAAHAKPRLAALREAAGVQAPVYFATDPDPGGEAVAWGVAEQLGVPTERLHRLLLGELTPSAVAASLRNPHPLNVARYLAHQARQVVDRVVEHHLSQLIRQRLSAGATINRLQAAALRLLVEEERQAPKGPPSSIVALIEAAAQTRSYAPRRTVALAQRLYELGLITFPRGTIVPAQGAPGPAHARLEPDEAVLYSLIWFPAQPTKDLGPWFTAASLIATIEQRGEPLAYTLSMSPDMAVEDESRRLRPTDAGKDVAKLLADLPDLLALIPPGTPVDDWPTIVQGFCERFVAALEHARRALEQGFVTCPSCAVALVFQGGRRGTVLLCQTCRRQYRFSRDEEGQLHLRLPEPLDRPCPACARPMEVRSGRYGKFAGCTGFPECKTTEPLEEPS